ncbi:hypothetical protein D9611_015139 [Ephemerocybe angulata]|uniref:Uncharacterized protein n=1 Tax=Ephemerocybe angulata TaxID=980116 RepID=A0A8H5C261_9AGAR|nr:hypothetical protein D9611_015139 [Tulosesus angulatus]
MADVFLKIEDEILSVPRASLSVSEVFEDMFQMPQPQDTQNTSGEGLEGSSKNNPIVLEGEKIAEWTSLVKLLVPLYAAIRTSPCSDTPYHSEGRLKGLCPPS